jgi:DNA-binding transcriptional LysR family regulator
MDMRSLNLDQLRAFVEVIERGSFTAAAKELNLTQPAVTRQVQELEHRFRVTLVERIGKRAYLTQAGERLIEHARHLLEEDARTLVAMRSFSDGWLGRVRIGTSMTVLMYLLPPILRQLKIEHPQLEINLKANLTSDTLRMLKTNALDLGLCAIPIEDSAFETVPLFEDELIAILPATWERVPKRATPAFLSRCPLILGNESSALRRTVTNWLALAGPPPKPVMEFDTVEAIKSLVSVGLAASIVPSLSLGDGHVTAANIRVVPLSPRTYRQVGLVRLRGKRGTDGVRLVAAALSTLRRPASTR